jgi:hypothetical protein
MQLLQRKTNEGKTTPINSVVTAEISLPGEKIPSGPGNNKIPKFPYHIMYN